ncbi:hypothetical protein HDA40_006302 [Hamadaea flava]|uniref:DUF983 domain-containing protein n=1 Tax=Hamadaea flava TaxID=1742688 RepID=A0ABV8LVT4_9ACTN|nr:hypothetical protein [Hamadaea flava]MCP2327795.1 hypothetical protein [Hamadaea flava]
MRVTSPGGTDWWVGRGWLPWRPHNWFDGDFDVDLDGDDLFGLILSVLGLILSFVLPILLGIVLTIGEWLALIPALPVVLLLRVGFGRPWPVGIRAGRGDHTYWTAISGWRASAHLIDDTARELTAFGEPRTLQAQVEAQSVRT